MARMRSVRQDDFTGGLNLRADQFQLGANESPKMLNVEIDPRGGVFSRGAMRRVNNSPVSAHWHPERLFNFEGARNYLLLSTGQTTTNSVTTNGNVFFSEWGDFSSMALTVTAPHGANFSPWGSKVFIATGRDSQSASWNGTTKTMLTASGPVWQNSYTTPTITPEYFPQAEHTVTHAGKVFVANTKENGVSRPNLVRWSHPNNPTNWHEQDFIEINDGGDEITGLATFGGHLVVFKHSAVFAIFGYDSDTFQVVEISRNVGSPTSHAFCTTERGIYFFSYPDGLMLYNGERIVDLFEPIRPAIINEQINPSVRFKIFVANINRRIWVSVPYSETGSVTEPSVSFVYDPTVSQRGAWLMFSTFDGFGHRGGCTFQLNTGESRAVVLHPTKPYVLWVDQYNSAYDNVEGVDNQFPSKYRTRWIDAGSYGQKKMWRRPDVVVKQQSTDTELNVKAYADYEEAEDSEIKSYSLIIPGASTGMIWGTTNWGANWGSASTGSQIITGRSIGLANSIQLEFDGPVGKTWGINSYSLKYNPRKVKA